MEPKQFKRRQGPELGIRTALVELMERRKWFVHITHGSVYSSGLPDLYCAHVNYGQRWIEVKHADAYHFTDDQMRVFSKMVEKNVGIWIVALPRDPSESMLEYEYENVVVKGPPNWQKYLGHSRRPY